MAGELNEERWKKARANWWAEVGTQRWARWERARRDEYSGGGTGEVKRIKAARRTATCLGGWELLVEWAGAWTDSWVGEAHLQSDGRGMAKKHKAQAAEAKREPMPVSMFDRITEKVQDGGEGGRGWRWRDTEAGGKRATARIVERAVTGDLKEKATQDAMWHLWQIFEAHAAELPPSRRYARVWRSGLK